MTLKVIGTGFGRTGTDSLREALNILGFGKCHHMFEVIDNGDQKRLWREKAKGGPVPWDLLFEGYQSCVDWPSAHYWPELIKAYPDARVILTWRSPESWWQSFAQTILPGITAGTDEEALGKTLIRDQVFSGRMSDRLHAIDTYNKNVDLVRQIVHADRLLIHELGDGWDALCAHLGVPIPDMPYPRRNAAGDFSANHDPAGDGRR